MAGSQELLRTGQVGYPKFPLVSLQREIFLVGSVKPKASWIALLQEPRSRHSLSKPVCCAGFGSQARSHALLKQLLALLRLGAKREAIRAPLLNTLLAYLQACRGPRIAHASADLFQAALSGMQLSFPCVFHIVSHCLLAPVLYIHI